MFYLIHQRPYHRLLMQRHGAP